MKTPGSLSEPQVLGPNDTTPWSSHLSLVHSSLYIRGPPLSPSSPGLEQSNISRVLLLTFASVGLAVSPTDHVVVDLKYLVVATDKLAVLLPARRGVVDVYEGVEQLGDLSAFSSGGLTPASHHGLAAGEVPRPLGQTDGADGPGGDDPVQGDDGDIMERSHPDTARPPVWLVPGH